MTRVLTILIALALSVLPMTVKATINQPDKKEKEKEKKEGKEEEKEKPKPEVLDISLIKGVLTIESLTDELILQVGIYDVSGKLVKLCFNIDWTSHQEFMLDKHDAYLIKVTTKAEVHSRIVENKKN